MGIKLLYYYAELCYDGYSLGKIIKNHISTEKKLDILNKNDNEFIFECTPFP